jgi:hypothetical protein
MAISPEQVRRIKTNDLNDDLVRVSLAGWFHQHLARFHAVDVAPEELYEALTRYAEFVPKTIAMGADLHESGMRPHEWPTKGKP